MYRMIVGCLVSIYLVLMFGPAAAAIESTGVGVLPAHPRANVPHSSSIIIHSAQPGATISDGVKVANNTDTSQTLAIYATDSQVSSDGAFACAQQVETPRKVGKWVSLSSHSVTLAAGKSATIPLTITMPQHIESGEYNGCIVVQETNPASTTTQNGIALQFRTAIRVALTVPGDLSGSVDIDKVVREPVDNIIRLKTTVKNPGSVSVDSGFRIQFSTLFGGSASPVGLGTYTVFPQVPSVFNFEVTNPFWGGWYQMRVQTIYHEPLPDGGVSSEQTVHVSDPIVVFVAPQPLALLIEALGLLALIYGISMLIYWLHRRRLDRKHTMHYTVRSGDTIKSIADAHGVSWRRIATYNRLKAPYTLAVGTKLQLPYSPALHTKKPDKG